LRFNFGYIVIECQARITRKINVAPNKTLKLPNRNISIIELP